MRKAIEKANPISVSVAPATDGLQEKSSKNHRRLLSFSLYAEGARKNEVTILWGSMYGMTAKAVDYAEKILQREGVKYNKLHMPLNSESEAVATVFQSAGIIIGAPTYEYKLFPPVAAALSELGRKRITGKTAFRFGSYGWSGGAEKELKEIVERNNMKWDFVESVEFEGAPKEEHFAKVEAGVMELLKKMREKVVE